MLSILFITNVYVYTVYVYNVYENVFHTQDSYRYPILYLYGSC